MSRQWNRLCDAGWLIRTTACARIGLSASGTAGMPLRPSARAARHTVQLPSRSRCLMPRSFNLPVFLFVVALTWIRLPAAEPTLSFNRDVRPILADKCFACHGPDARKRQAELRLDLEEG